MDPQVTVIIPVFNRCASVPEAIRSVLSQGVDDVEIIVVDDGSSDNVDMCLERFAEQIRVIRQDHRGAGAARNVGIAAAKSRIIAFLDSDDEWMPGKLRAQIDFLESRPEVQWTACASEAVLDLNADPRPRHDSSRMVTAADIRIVADWFAEYERSIVTTTSGVAVRARALEEVGGFDEVARSGHDYDLWFRLAIRHPRLGFCFKPAFRYRTMNPDSISASSGDLYDDKFRLLARHVDWEISRLADDSRTMRVIQQSLKFVRRSLEHGRSDLSLSMLEGLKTLIPRPHYAFWRFMTALPTPFVKAAYQVFRTTRRTAGRASRFIPSKTLQPRSPSILSSIE